MSRGLASDATNLRYCLKSGPRGDLGGWRRRSPALELEAGHDDTADQYLLQEEKQNDQRDGRTDGSSNEHGPESLAHISSRGADELQPEVQWHEISGMDVDKQCHEIVPRVHESKDHHRNKRKIPYATIHTRRYAGFLWDHAQKRASDSLL